MKEELIVVLWIYCNLFIHIYIYIYIYIYFSKPHVVKVLLSMEPEIANKETAHANQQTDASESVKTVE